MAAIEKTLKEQVLKSTIQQSLRMKGSS